ncbi:Large ribosomal subunit protein uL29m [Abortiporus biennis]
MLPQLASGRVSVGSCLRTLVSTSQLQSRIVANQARGYASVVPQPRSNNVKTHRPRLNVEVDPNHGLYAFFRKKINKDDGAVSYETIEAKNLATVESGRSWTAAELRRKSFKDLHTLWYVLLREKNLLATQREEARRATIDVSLTPYYPRYHKVRKSMARIKYIINERRLAYEGALGIMAEKNKARLEQKRLRLEASQQAHSEKEAQEAKEAEKQKAAQESPEGRAADLAAAGLFQSVPASQPSAEKH